MNRAHGHFPALFWVLSPQLRERRDGDEKEEGEDDTNDGDQDEDDDDDDDDNDCDDCHDCDDCGDCGDCDDCDDCDDGDDGDYDCDEGAADSGRIMQTHRQGRTTSQVGVYEPAKPMFRGTWPFSPSSCLMAASKALSVREIADLWQASQD